MPASETFDVLLVEDNPGDARLTRALLDEAEGGVFRVTHVERLGAAVAYLAGDGADVVLLDLSLPDACGMEAVTGLLDAAPDLPLVVLSGLDDERFALEAVLKGAQDYLIKGEGGCGLMKRAIRYAIERKRAERRLQLMAERDPLTGLANRLLFHDRLVQALRRVDGRDRLAGLIFIDLDGFKPVNDAHGHDAGDALLRGVAERIAGAVRRTDTVARMGGDEFTVVLEGLRCRGDAVRVAEKILAGLDEPFALAGGIRVRIGASLGVALAEDPGEDPDALVRRADAAMYRAKAEGGQRFEVHDGARAVGLLSAPEYRAVA